MFTLALALGKTVAEISQISSVELSEWEAYYRINPFGEWRADYRAGVISSAVVAPHTKYRVKPEDFIPKFMPEPKQTPAQLGSFFMALTTRMGGEVK